VLAPCNHTRPALQMCGVPSIKKRDGPRLEPWEAYGMMARSQAPAMLGRRAVVNDEDTGGGRAWIATPHCTLWRSYCTLKYHWIRG
jgi:hypothetical protein